MPQNKDLGKINCHNENKEEKQSDEDRAWRRVGQDIRLNEESNGNKTNKRANNTKYPSEWKETGDYKAIFQH